MDVKSQEPAPAPTRREAAFAVIAAALAALGLAAFAALDAGALVRCALAAAAAWWLARRLGLGALGALFSAVSFGGSAAVLAGPATGRAEPSGAGPFELGLLLVVVAMATGWRSAARSPWMTALSVPAVAALLLAVSRLFGAPWLALAPDALGGPGWVHGYLGAGSFDVRSAPWVPLPTLALALAAALSGRGRLRARNAVAALAFGAFLGAVSGLLPLGPAVLPAALFLALLAGEGLEAAPRPARLAAALTVVALAIAVMRVDAELLTQPSIPGDPPDGLVVLSAPPAEHYVGVRGVLFVAGEVRAPVGATGVDAALESLRADGAFVRREELAVEVDSLRAPDGGLSFRTRELDLRRLTSGVWRWSLDVLGAGGEPIGRRDGDSFVVRHPPLLSAQLLLACAGVLAAALLARPGSRPWALCLTALAVLQILDFSLLL